MADQKPDNFRLTDYGMRYYSNDLTPSEQKSANAQRAKTDKLEVAHEKAMKKAAAIKAKTQGTQADHHVTDSSTHTQIIGDGMIKTPIAPKTGSTTKTPVKPNISLKNK